MLNRSLIAFCTLVLAMTATTVHAADGGSFTLTSVNIEGSLEEDGVREAIGKQIVQLAGCAAPGDAPAFSQPIDVKIQVVKGKVKRFATEADNGADPRRMQCVERELRKFRFPRGGGKAVVRMTLSPAAGGSAAPASEPPASAATPSAPRPTGNRPASSDGSVRVQVVSAVGPIAAPAAQGALQNRADAIAACASRQRRAVSGELALKLRINTAGRIDKRALKHDGVGNRKLSGCVMKAVQGTLFEAMSQGSTIVDVTLQLQASGSAREEAPAADTSGLPELPQRDDVLHIIVGMRSQVAACAADASGRVAIKTVIHGPSGKPVSVRMRTRFPRSVQSCIRKTTAQMRLPPFQKRSFEILYHYDL